MSLNPTSTHTVSEKPLKSILPIFPSVPHSILSITSREKPKILNLPFLTDEEEKEKKTTVPMVSGVAINFEIPS